MYQSMKAHSFKAVLPWILICFAAGALLVCFVTKFTALTLLRGPVNLDDVAQENLAGSYVSFDQSRLVAVYASASASDAEDSSDITTYYMILRYRDDQYLTLITTAKQYQRFDSALAQAENYYTGDLETLNAMGRVSGFIEPADADLPETMAEQIASVAKSFKDTGLPGTEEDGDIPSHILPYAVRLERQGWLSYGMIWTATILWIVLFLLGLALLALQLTGYYQREVRSYLGRSGDAFTQAQIEADFANAQVFDAIRVGDLYTWFYKGAKAYVFLTGEIIWVYKALYARTSDKYRWGITVYLKDHTKRVMYMPQDANRGKIIRAYQSKGLAFVSDYKSSYEALFRDDFNAFCQLALDEKADRERTAREKAMWEQV